METALRWWHIGWDRLCAAMRILWLGPTKYARLTRLLGSPPYLAMAKAVKTVDTNPDYRVLSWRGESDHAKREAAKELANKILLEEHSMTMGAYTWELNFLLEWCVGEEHGRF